jgi:small-conductance mechanosensitive channel
MRVWTFAFALMLFVAAPPPARPAEPAGATVVLHLPPSMSADAVRGLIADLAAKGARPATAGADPGPGTSVTTAELAAGLWEAASRAIRTVPHLRRMPEHWIDRVEAEGGTRALALRFWIVALVGLAAAPLIGQCGRRLLDRGQARIADPGLAIRLRAAAIRLGVALASLGLFALVFWAALFAISSGLPILGATADRLVWAGVKWRAAIIILLVVVSPRRPDLRLLAIDDADARTCSRWLAPYLMVSPFNVFAIGLCERLGFVHDAVFGAALALGLAVTAYKIAMFWAVRRPIAHAILAARCGEPGQFRRAVAASWHWLFIAGAIGVLAAATIAFSLGSGAWVASAATSTQGIVVALAVLWQAARSLIERQFAGDQTDLRFASRRERFRRVLRRLCDALLSILAAVWLGETWGFDIIAPAQGTFARLFVRPAFGAAATIVAAWILWTALSAVIDNKMPQTAAPGDEDEAGVGSASRLGTLLPLLRNLLMIGLAVVAVIAALSTLGLNIGPLLAGLGVIGIAIGFGAQTLVRDVISGLFFLMEDAFRVGEYIDTGRLRGTVEGMSLRSVRLRHQNGQVHTIPFGQVQAVTNFSRDWSVIKFNLHLEPAVDIETVRRTVKRVGQELLDDPEIGADFIGPLKMQGVVDVLQNALVVRCKFTATPLRPTYLQRQALRRLIEAFGAAGIRFAAPQVTLELASAAAR